ncbi:nucleoside diphosphate kinase family protein, putative [Ichthyophthirius multifiliis]|uniref:Nucleoside diphosphate kinase family protein, putative n=1 Tax=Ichthyophthirius multifiliis TaxID=5932 RepID=G0R223_ICHMU|nr:nucleoside diphosphate kinase family protein, putative [Ichthyophthirius multifiliis]EGR28487.1 nucleoside diphosphate kinase family protein, putative [Ichthyophthirius multifiliis]|eukprot:XP_004029723.1 nucleoside diphosphate kinase family protein, putative [Ichthyophthirius multifiliis]
MEKNNRQQRPREITSITQFYKRIIKIKKKKEQPQCLRSIYGKSLIKNELHGSDNMIDANKERDIFKFPIPQKIPVFKFEKMKLTIETIQKFIFPPNLEHVNINERLDIFALYGPVLNHHSVDKCFCVQCSRLGKELLDLVRQEKIFEQKQRLGISTKNDETIKRLEMSMSTSSKGSKMKSKIYVPAIRLLDEEVIYIYINIYILYKKNIQSIYNQLCDKCKLHCDCYAHLVGGRNCYHILSDQEIQELAKEINRQELLDLLIIEKGNAANIMIENISLVEPENLQSSRELMKVLFKNAPTDYYDRYDFYDLQQLILEDRRIRINAWISQIIGKPIDRFKNPKLVDKTINNSQRQNLKSYNFTLNRNLPLKMITKKENITYTPIEFPKTLIDKPKLQQNEESFALLQKLHRYTTQILSVDNLNQNVSSYKINVFMLRNYNEGRHGSWQNYCSLNKTRKGSYVKTLIQQKQDERNRNL